jgi:hypothetical protein
MGLIIRREFIFAIAEGIKDAIFTGVIRELGPAISCTEASNGFTT